MVTFTTETNKKLLDVESDIRKRKEEDEPGGTARPGSYYYI